MTSKLAAIRAARSILDALRLYDKDRRPTFDLADVRRRTKTVFLSWMGFVVYLTAVQASARRYAAVAGLVGWLLWLLLDNETAFPAISRNSKVLYLALTVATYGFAIPYAPVLAISAAPLNPQPLAGLVAAGACLWLIALAIFEYRTLLGGLRIKQTAFAYVVCFAVVGWVISGSSNVGHLSLVLHLLALVIADLILSLVVLVAWLSVNAVADLFYE